MEAAKDPREMRKQIDESILARFGDDNAFSHCANLIHTADNAARYAGWSGEDRMTAIAYLALQRAEELTKRLLQVVNSSPAPIILQTPPPPKD